MTRAMIKHGQTWELHFKDETVKSPEAFEDRRHMSWFIILKDKFIQNKQMLVDQLTGRHVVAC